jgi:hypothetical protein
MMMPSMVSSDRPLLMKTARKAVLRVSGKSMVEVEAAEGNE